MMMMMMTVKLLVNMKAVRRLVKTHHNSAAPSLQVLCSAETMMLLVFSCVGGAAAEVEAGGWCGCISTSGV